MDRFKIRKGFGTGKINGYNRQTYIYVMQDSNGCKFGITNDLNRRQKQYRETRPSLRLKYRKVLENRNIARLIEYKMKLHFPIIKELGCETTSAPLEELIEFIESSNTCLEDAILELPKNLQPKDFDLAGKPLNPLTDKSERSYTLEDKRMVHANAYNRWKESEDKKLLELYKKGKSIKELAKLFQRKNSAIKARINKLEVKR